MIEDHFKWIKVWEDLIVNEDYVSKTVLELKENIIDSIYFKINEGPDLNKLKYKKHLFLDWLREQNVDQNKITMFSHTYDQTWMLACDHGGIGYLKTQEYQCGLDVSINTDWFPVLESSWTGEGRLSRCGAVCGASFNPVGVQNENVSYWGV